MAGTNKLSDKKLRALLGAARSKEEMLADGEGLSVRLLRSGAISWIFAYRLGGRGSKLERLTLGSYPDMSLKMAREKREECRSWLAEGKNPKFQLDIKTEEILRPVTVRDAMTYWFNEYAIHHRVNWERHQAQVEKHIYPYIGDLPLSLCETRHWLECFDRAKRETPYAAGYVFQMCKQALKFCRVRRYAISNALDDLTIQDVGKKQEKGDRVHDMGELTQIWLSTTGKMYKPYYASLLRLLVVFGCRSQEIRLSTWKEWDLKDWIWIVPKEHSKGGENLFVRSLKLFGPLSRIYTKSIPILGYCSARSKSQKPSASGAGEFIKGWAKLNHGRYTIYAELLPPRLTIWELLRMLSSNFWDMCWAV